MTFRRIQTNNIISTEVGFTDPVIILNKDGSTPVDIGFLGKIGATTYTGLVKDSDTNQFLLIDSINLDPNSINDISASDLSLVPGHLTVGTLIADNIVNSSIPTTLSTLTDVDDVDTAVTGDMILHDGTKWRYVNLEDEINTRITASQNTQTLLSLSDVGFTNDTVAAGDFLLYDSSTGKFGFVDFASEVQAYVTAGALSNVADASYGADVTGKLAVSGGIDMDIGTTLKLEAGTVNFSSSTVVFNSATVAGLDNETVGLDNIENSAQGVNVTGKVAASDGLDVDIGGTITASACTLDFTSSTVNFSGASVGGLDASASTSLSQPSSPSAGDIWFDTSNDILYVYNNSSSSWTNVAESSNYVSTTGNNTITSTDTGSSAGPELELFRDNSSPSNADYLGQIKFQGNSANGTTKNYAKITGKILDSSANAEDGILEFAFIKNGSQNISGRFRSDSLQLINGTNLYIGGTGAIQFEGANSDAYETSLEVAEPTADRTITLPDATGTVALENSTATFDKVRITSTSDATASSTGHGFQVGTDGGQNIIMDTNEVFARNNGLVSGLHLNADGGEVTINNNLSDKVTFSSGGITATGDITAFSDDSLKTNVQVIDNAVSKVEQLRGVTFERIENGTTSTGVIAQELKKVLPEAVHTNEQGLHSVAYGNVVGLLIEAIKEQQKQIDKLIKDNQSKS